MPFKMIRTSVVLILVASLFFSCQTNTTETMVEDTNLASYVNCFVGTDGPGNTYPGAVLPFGMVQLSPDNGLPGWDRIAGYYWPDSTIAGFSHKHLSGTGAGDLYDILVLPYNSRFTADLWPEQEHYRPYSMFSHDAEAASPGYYSVDLLSSGIKAELTTTQRVGMHRYTFPADEESKILIDLGYKLNWDDPTDTYLKLEDETTIVGHRYSRGWAPDQREHFVMKLSKPIADIAFYANGKKVDAQEANAKYTKAEIKFKSEEGEQVLIKMALSSHSIEGAKKNLETELAHWDFNEVVAGANQAWNEYLSKIKIKGTQEQKELFYTNLYHCFLTPSLHSDVDGFYKGADGQMHQAVGYNKYDTFSLWDTFRATHPLYTMLCPDETVDMIKSFLSHYDETGLLPVWSMAGNETFMMIGYHAVPVIVDAYFKGIEMDAPKALEACVASANEKGRQIDQYIKYGYVPATGEGESWSVSKTLEYAYNDWCIAQMAMDMGEQEVYDTFAQRMDYWKNLYDPASTFFRPKDVDGEFILPFLAKDYGPEYCESNAWQYFWFVPHDVQGLIDTLGYDRFSAKLDSMFNYYPKPEDKLPIFSTGMIGQYAHGNEPSHHVAYLYNYIGKPHKTQEMVRRIIDTQYSLEPDGYCGNEDCGQMSAWLVYSAMGMYPVNPADGVYHLTSPTVSEATVKMANGKQFVVKADNQSKENKYIQQMFLNGEPYNELTITHQQMAEGGELRFVLGNMPRK
ncbi:alpha-1,2-mannosidase, putative [Saccharicrinis carchari]|uniref:Alpha-1,2-mannosidase, putative n=2 Tax=Saccharicrinis carchari TaxID=1168039 RepID=A0A521CY48_SACCC|nr:alpha-1,2-mannosidase, putative [Saccharicrinis carchari]